MPTANGGLTEWVNSEMPFILQSAPLNQAELDLSWALIFPLKAFCSHWCWNPTAGPHCWLLMAGFPSSTPKVSLLFAQQLQALCSSFSPGEEAFLGAFFVWACWRSWVGRFYSVLSSVCGRQWRDPRNSLPGHSASSEFPQAVCLPLCAFQSLSVCAYCVTPRVF